jgi:hypothetical protein
MRLDFLAFNHRCFREINPTTPFEPNWHIEVIGAALEDCRQGRMRRLIINVPPRSLKSLTASVAFPAWLLGHNPSTKIISASYGQDLSDKHARDCRQIMNSKFYGELFVAICPTGKQSRNMRLLLAASGTRPPWAALSPAVDLISSSLTTRSSLTRRFLNASAPMQTRGSATPCAPGWTINAPG